MQEPAAKLIGRPKGTGSQRVYEVTRSRILSLEMAPGAGIDESALVAEFGVSRTPVREALIRLATEGFVTLLPNRGASVSPLDIAEIPELLAAMELCLRVTSRWAAVRRSDADLAQLRRCQERHEKATRDEDYVAMSEANSSFHLAVAETARNRHLVKLYSGLIPQYNRLSLSLLSTAKTAAPFYRDYFARVNEEHRRLVNAIEAQDSEAADVLSQSHARLIGERLQTYVWSGLADPIRIGDDTGAPLADEPR